MCVIDYKTGAVPSKSELQKCLKIQLPLEAFMALYYTRSQIDVAGMAASSPQVPRSQYFSRPSIAIRAIQLKQSIGVRNDISILFSPQLEQILRQKISDTLCEYLTAPFITTAKHKSKHAEYSHLERL
jgi:hypothetical protein